MPDRAADAWELRKAYEPYVGRWSRLVVAKFLLWLAAPRSAAGCDVGCGTGVLARAAVPRRSGARTRLLHVIVGGGAGKGSGICSKPGWAGTVGGGSC